MEVGSRRQEVKKLTEYEALEEEIDPAHDDHLRDHHDHLRLHTRHHAVHRVGVREGVRRCARGRVSFRRAILEVRALGERMREVLRDRLVVGRGKGGVRRRRAKDLGADEGTSALRSACVREHAASDGAEDVLFPNGVSWEFLRGRLEQKDDVVPQNAH